MGKREKLLARLRRIPVDFSWSELALVFEACGYELVQKGGSHCFFVSTKRGDIFHLFRPHGRGENSLPRRILEKSGRAPDKAWRDLMDKVFRHKGYSGSVEPDLDSGTLRGEVLFVTDTLLYEGRTIGELEKAFRATVDQYLALCRERGLEPKKPFKGSVTVRIGEKLHEMAALDAVRRGQTLNQWMTEAVALRTEDPAKSKPGRGKSRMPRKVGKMKTVQGTR